MQNYSDLLISADSHVIEPADLWEKNLPQAFRAAAPRYPEHNFSAHEGGTDPVKRVTEMEKDGVSGEVLYPSLTLNQYGIGDAALQEACFKIYNDWLIQYCSHCPGRLFGIATISAFNIDNAIKEVHRVKKAGMRGVMLWQVPPPELSFATDHYDRLWAVLQELELPVSLHILTGPPYAAGAGPTKEEKRNGALAMARSVNIKAYYAANALTDFIGSGALERFPKLKLVLVENEASWLPFYVTQWDKYASRGKYDGRMKRLPGEYFQRQIYTTFFNDPPISWTLGQWGNENCMWSNDFPHTNSTWPKSREVIARDLSALSESVRTKVLSGNVTTLYKLPVLEPVAAVA